MPSLQNTNLGDKLSNRVLKASSFLHATILQISYVIIPQAVINMIIKTE